MNEWAREEEQKRWEAAQGGRPLRDGGLRRYPSGALLYMESGRRAEPIPGEYENLTKRVRVYWTKRLARAEEDFYRLKNALMGYGFVYAGSLNHPEVVNGCGPQDGLTVLERLKVIVEEYRRELAAVDARIAATPEAIERRRLMELDQEAARAEAERLAAIQTAAAGITI